MAQLYYLLAKVERDMEDRGVEGSELYNEVSMMVTNLNIFFVEQGIDVSQYQ